MYVSVKQNKAIHNAKPNKAKPSIMHLSHSSP